jgi:hypothetical protein
MKFGYEFNENLITPRQHKVLMNSLCRMVGNVHKFSTLPGHFVEGANRKYHYKRRTTKYLEKKKKLYGENRPDLVASGLTMAAVLKNSKITATWDHWRLYVMKLPFPIQDWMRAEIEKINKTEIKDYCRLIGSAYKRNLPQYARKRRVKGS